MLIDFSGTAGQVKGAFRTEIHKLDVNGVAHIANVSGPYLPEALQPVVAGVVSLTDFRSHAKHKHKATSQYTGTTNATVPVISSRQAILRRFTTSIHCSRPRRRSRAKGRRSPSWRIRTSMTTRIGPISARLSGCRNISGSLQIVHPAASRRAGCLDPGDPLVTLPRRSTVRRRRGDARRGMGERRRARCDDPGRNLQSHPDDRRRASRYRESLMRVRRRSSASAMALAKPICRRLFASPLKALSAGRVRRDFRLRGVRRQRAGYLLRDITPRPRDTSPRRRREMASMVGCRRPMTSRSAEPTSATPQFAFDLLGEALRKPWGSAKSYIPENPSNDTCASTLTAAYFGFLTHLRAPPASATVSWPRLRLSKVLQPLTGNERRAEHMRHRRSQLGTCKAILNRSGKRACLGSRRRQSETFRMFRCSHRTAPSGASPMPSVTPIRTPMGRRVKAIREIGRPGNGGTSFAAPIVAGIQALINQKMNGAPQGNPTMFITNWRRGYMAYGASACNSTSGYNILL